MAELIDLALAQFPDLKPAERNVIDAATTGSLRLLGDVKDYDQGIAGAAKWGDDHVVRAEFLRWLCTNEDALGKVDSRGITVYYGKIVGELDLKFLKLAFPLSFYQCVFEERLDVEQLELPALGLSGSQLALLWAVRLKCNGDLRLDDGFSSSNTVYLGSSDIAGDLRMNGAKINAEEIAVAAAYSRVRGNVQMGQGYDANGLTGLASVEIGGDLNLTGGKFQAPQDPQKTRAVSLAGARVGGSVMAQAQTEIHGTADFLGATVGRDFDFSGCKLSHAGEVVLLAERIRVGGDAFFGRGLDTDGVLTLFGSHFEGNVNCDHIKFTGTQKNGMVLETASIGRTLSWRSVRHNERTFLNLIDASVSRFLDNRESWPARGNLRVAGLTYSTIGGVGNVKQRCEWLQLQSRDNDNLQPWAHLAAICEARGLDDDARAVRISKEEWRFSRPGLPLHTRVWGKLLKYTVGYGYSARTAGIWTVLMISIGWWVFAMAHARGVMLPVGDGVYRDSVYRATGALPQGFQTLNSFVYSVDTFLPIVDLHQEENWLPDPAARCNGYPCGSAVRWFLWAFIAVGWAFSSLVVIGFTGIVRRE